MCIRDSDWMDPKLIGLDAIDKKFDTTATAIKARKATPEVMDKALAKNEAERSAELIAARKAQRDLRQNVRGALLGNVNKSIVTPEIGDRPLVMHRSNSAKAIGQFTAFMLAANQKVFLSGLQGRQLWLASGITSGTLIGMYIEYFKLWERSGQKEANKLFDNYARLITAGMDRGGTIPLVFKANDIMQKLNFPDLYDASALAAKAVGHPDRGNMQGQASRYGGQKPGEMLSPLVGVAGDLLNVTSVLVNQEMSKRAVNSIIRMTPGARLPYWNWLIQQERDVAGWKIGGFKEFAQKKLVPSPSARKRARDKKRKRLFGQ